jgi:ferredoxin--NADP+ reductase
MTISYNATITFRVDLIPGTMIIRVKPDGDLFSYEPGQYTVLGLHRSSSRIPDAAPDSPEIASLGEDVLIKRAYSISDNSKGDELEFVISLVRSGSLTPRLFNLKQGARIYLNSKAVGAFTLERSSGNRDLLLMATGSAIAPYISMLRKGFPENTQQHYIVVHAAEVSWDLVFRAQMEELAGQSVNFTYLPVITDEERDLRWGGLRGTIQQLIRAGEIEEELGLPITPDRFDVYLAGNPAMIDAVSAELEKIDFKHGPTDDPNTNIFMERYW